MKRGLALALLVPALLLGAGSSATAAVPNPADGIGVDDVIGVLPGGGAINGAVDAGQAIAGSNAVQGVVADACGSREYPGATRPDSGISGWFGATPDQIPPHENPWLDGARTSVYQQYGPNAPTWWTYDAGCFNFDASINNFIANSALFLPKIVNSMSAAFVDVAYAPAGWINFFDPTMVSVQEALRVSIWVSGIVVVFGFLGLYILYGARNGKLSTGLSALLWSLLIVMIAAVLFRFPTQAARSADATLANTVGVASASIAGNEALDMSVSDAINTSVRQTYVDQAFQLGAFGCVRCPASDKYTSLFTKATQYTWDEDRQADQDPAGRGAELRTEKEGLFIASAGALKNEFPEAYEFFTGKRAEGKLAGVFVMWFGTGTVQPFILFGAILVIISYIIFRVIVMTAPAWLTLGAAPKLENVAISVGSTGVAALVNASIFGILGAVYMRIARELMMNDAIPLWWSLTLCGMFAFVIWHLSKPFTRLTQMVKGGKHQRKNYWNSSLPTPVGVLQSGANVAQKAALAATTGGTAVAASTFAERMEERKAERRERNSAPPAEASSDSAPPENDDAPATSTPVPTDPGSDDLKGDWRRFANKDLVDEWSGRTPTGRQTREPKRLHVDDEELARYTGEETPADRAERLSHGEDERRAHWAERSEPYEDDPTFTPVSTVPESGSGTQAPPVDTDDEGLEIYTPSNETDEIDAPEVEEDAR